MLLVNKRCMCCTFWFALFLAVSLLIRTLKCSGTGLGSGGKKEAVTRSGLGLVGCPNSFCQSSSHCFCMFSKLRTIV